MGLFKSKYEKELDGIIADINMNMNNNYKDNAQAKDMLHEYLYQDIPFAQYASSGDEEKD